MEQDSELGFNPEDEHSVCVYVEALKEYDATDPFGYGETAKLEAYTNKIDGMPDPILRYPTGKWVHFSTVRHRGYYVRNNRTMKIVVIDDLSVCCEYHAKNEFYKPAPLRIAV